MHAKKAAVVAILLATRAEGASIGIFADPACTSCNLAIPDGGTATAYVTANTDGLPSWVTGIVGAEFRIVGLPPGWLATATPSSLTVISTGDPTGPVGAQILLAPPQLGSCIPLYSISITATTPLSDVVLQVTHRNP